MELNQTLPHVRCWARFDNACPQFGVYPLPKNRAQILPIFDVFRWPHNLASNSTATFKFVLEAPNSSWCNNMLQYVTTRQPQPALTFPTSTPHFGDAQPGGYDPKFKLGRDFCTIHLPPSFIILCILVLKLSCWQTNTRAHTNKQTNRSRWNHPTLFATLRRWVIIAL